MADRSRGKIWSDEAWKFFDEIDTFLTKRHNVTPPALVDTMAETDVQLDNLEDNSSSAWKCH